MSILYSAFLLPAGSSQVEWPSWSFNSPGPRPSPIKWVTSHFLLSGSQVAQVSHVVALGEAAFPAPLVSWRQGVTGAFSLIHLEHSPPTHQDGIREWAEL